MENSRPGFWNSDLSEEQAVNASRDYSQVQLAETGEVYWVEYRPDDEGRNLICGYVDNQLIDITPAGFSVQSRVHEYGGRSWLLMDSLLVFVNAEDQQLYLQAVRKNSSPQQLTHCPESRFIEPVWDQTRRRLIVVEELHIGEVVINRLSSVDLESGFVSPLHQQYDFYAYPALSADGQKLAFISWNHPEQPWTSTSLKLSTFDSFGGLDCPVDICAELESAAITHPQFDESGQLFFVSDHQGWWNLYKADLDKDVISDVVQTKADIVPAPWQSGLLNYQVTDNKTVWIEYRHEGAQLIHSGRNMTPEGFCYFRSIAVGKNAVYCVAAGPDRLPGILEVGPNVCNVLTGCKRLLPEQQCSKPVAMTFTAKGTSYGYLYRARNADTEAVQKAPLIVFLHGGPTAATYPILNLKIQYWTQRGFAVLDLNYRGSSNYGRDYRMALKANWGLVEVEDIRNSLAELIEQGEVDAQALFIRGGSSGGYSALNALAELDLFAGGASLYGVSDPLALGKVTHKFESRYLDWLIGPPNLDGDKYKKMSPINKAEKITCPVVFFQGEQDRVVVPEQTRSMVNQLISKGVRTESFYFDNEAHGFRRPENQQKALSEELKFYQSIINEH